MSHQNQHYQVIRDAKKNLADVEFLLETSPHPETIGVIEEMLKQLGSKAQIKRQKIIHRQKELKKE